VSVLVALLATVQPALSADPILIGVSAPLTGDNAGTGQESLNGAKLAAKQINAKGGRSRPPDPNRGRR
jgi:branched-chain amino acid transport system substrate-binding protein